MTSPDRIAIDTARGDKLPANAPLQLDDVVTRGTSADPALSVWRVVRVWRLEPTVADRYGWPDPHSAWKATLASEPDPRTGSRATLTIALDPPTAAELDVPPPAAPVQRARLGETMTGRVMFP